MTLNNRPTLYTIEPKDDKIRVLFPMQLWIRGEWASERLDRMPQRTPKEKRWNETEKTMLALK
jgi:hypothetical protein